MEGSKEKTMWKARNMGEISRGKGGQKRKDQAVE